MVQLFYIAFTFCAADIDKCYDVSLMAEMENAKVCQEFAAEFILPKLQDFSIRGLKLKSYRCEKVR